MSSETGSYIDVDRPRERVYDETVAEYSVFDKLVAGLSTSERRDMLQRIASSVKVIEPDTTADEYATVDLEERFARMGLLRRLVVMVVAFFTGRELLSVVETYLLRDLGRSVNARLPHGFDIVGQQLRPGAVEDFSRLAEHSRRFADILSRVMGRERRGFVAFLASLHAPEAHERLHRDTDPFAIAAEQPELKEADVRRRALNEVEEAVSTLPPAIRQKIYTDVRGLHNLMLLSSFPFDRIRIAFEPAPGGDAVPVPLSRVVDELARLAGLFEGLRQDPSPVLFEALALYEERDELGGEDDAVERVVQAHVNRFAEAYEQIREFGRHYPLVDLVRIAHANIHFRPTPPGGGEDWFNQWKSFWRDRVEEAHRRYAYQRHIESLLSQARSALEIESIGAFPGYPPSGLDQLGRHGLSMGLLKAFFDEVFVHDVAAPVGALYREGEFYKADNRADMDRAWRALERLQTDLANFEVRLRPSGDLGMAWRQANEDSLPPDAARERRLSLVASIDGDASALLHRAVETLRLLGELIQGVLYGTVGGRYDTVSNLGELGGRSADRYVTRLERAHVRVKGVADVLSDLQNVETTMDSA